METSEFPISKLDAAHRQLDAAVRLYFSYGDPVSIHTLAAAAYGLIDGVASARGGPRGFKASLLADYPNPAQRKGVQKQLNEADNFFKHADRDPEKILNFRPVLTEYLLADGCWRYITITGRHDPVLETFKMWFIEGAERGLDMTPEQERLRAEARKLHPNERQAYFESVLPVATRLYGEAI